MTNTRNILTIIALSALGLCLFMALAKMAMKGDKRKKACDNVCGMLVFIATVLLAVAQFMEDSKPEKFHQGKPHGKSHGHSSSSGGQDYELVVLSAASWCPHCQSMANQKDELAKELAKHGVKMTYIDDIKDKKEFEAMGEKLKEMGAKLAGFPHSSLLKDGHRVADMPGFRPTDAMVAEVKKHM